VLPLARPGGVAKALVPLLLSGVLVSAVWALSRQGNRALLALALVLCLPAIGLRWAGLALETPASLTILQLAAEIAFLGLTTLCVLWLVLRSEEVTPDTLCGGVAVYLLFGFAFADLYQLLALLEPQAFRPPLQDPVDGIYFSFVTLTTLGYGDVVPVSRPARGYALIEALIAQVYLAILVARLVGQHLASHDAATSSLPEDAPPGAKEAVE